jgi:hypothetical protein
MHCHETGLARYETPKIITLRELPAAPSLRKGFHHNLCTASRLRQMLRSVADNMLELKATTF